MLGLASFFGNPEPSQEKGQSQLSSLVPSSNNDVDKNLKPGNTSSSWSSKITHTTRSQNSSTTTERRGGAHNNDKANPAFSMNDTDSEHLSKLKKKYLKFERELVQLKFEHARLQALDEQRSLNRKIKGEDVIYWKGMLKDITEERVILRGRALELRSKRYLLEQDVENVTKEHNQKCKDRTTVDEKLGEAKLQCKETKEQIDDLKNESRELAKSIQQLKRNAVAIAKERISIQLHRDKIKDDIETLRKLVDESTKEVSNCKDKIRKTVMEKEEFEKDAEMVQEQNDILKDQILSIQQSKESVKNNLKDQHKHKQKRVFGVKKPAFWFSNSSRFGHVMPNIKESLKEESENENVNNKSSNQERCLNGEGVACGGYNFNSVSDTPPIAKAAAIPNECEMSLSSQPPPPMTEIYVSDNNSIGDTTELQDSVADSDQIHESTEIH